MENILEKLLQLKKRKMKVFNFLSKIANCKLVTKTSILSDHEKIVVILFCKIFPEIKKSWKICKRFLLILKVNAFQKKYDCCAQTRYSPVSNNKGGGGGGGC